MRANPRSPVSGSRTPTASDRLSVLMYGNGMARVHRERRQHREDLLEEALAQPLVMARQLGVVRDADAGLVPVPRAASRTAPTARRRDPRPVPGSAPAARPPSGRPATGRCSPRTSRRLLLQAGDADLEELVEVRREDRQELRALEERISGVARLVQDSSIELEPRQLAIDVRRRKLDGLHATPGRCRAPGDDGT